MVTVRWMLAFIAICLAEPSAAQSWSFAGWSGGGCYPNVEFDDHAPGRVFLASDVAGLWRSDDNGETWRFATNGLLNLHVTQIAISRGSPEIIYAATKGGLFFSKDLGASWSSGDTRNGTISFERPASYRSVSVDPARSEGVCVGTLGGQTYCSQNHGLTWEDLKMPAGKGTVVAIQRLPDNAGLIVARADGVWRYDFTARSWHAAKPALSEITDLSPDLDSFMAAAAGSLWRSDDGGLHWQKRTGWHPGQLFRLERAGHGTFLAAWTEDWKGGVLRSTDGSHWDGADASMIADSSHNPTRNWAAPNGPVTAIKASPFNPDILFRTDWWGVWRSDDGGRTWNEKIAGTPNSVGSDLGISPSGALYAATMDDGLLRSRDAGRSFEALVPSTRYDPEVSGHIWRVAFPKPGRILATSSPWNVKINQILLSDDDGRSFRRIRSGLPASRPRTNTLWEEGFGRALAVDPRGNGTVYLGIDGDEGGLFISRDAGETWARSPGQPPFKRIYNGLAIDPNRPDTIYWGAVGAGGGVYRSLDGGKSWALVFQGSRSIFDLLAAPNGTIYATGDMAGPAIFVSHDHGTTWGLLQQFHSADSVKAIAVSPADANMLAASTTNWTAAAPASVYLSRDGGTSWADITADLPPGAGAAALQFSPDGHYLYNLRYAGGLYRFAVGNR